MVKVSVIMSVYAEPIEWIKEAINSILNQTFKDFEFIIVNDNPIRKENIMLLNNFKSLDYRVVILKNDKNIGLTKSLNKAIEISKGKYIARMDADDISLPTRFEKQVDFLEMNEDHIVCGTNIKCFEYKDTTVVYPEDKFMFLFLKSPFAHPTVMFRNLQKEKGGKIKYNEDFKYAQDYELWSRLYKLGRFYNLQEVLLKYRVSEQQISKEKLSEQQFYAGKTRRKAFNNFCKKEKLNFVLSKRINTQELKRYELNILSLERWSKIEKDTLLNYKYYLYRSITEDYLSALLYFIKSLDFLKMTGKNSLKILFFLLTRKPNRLIN
ncbi:glycosyltransferase [Tenacibaculum ascidiaceicola]|uniref:glycosyltransferase n=1 Tax=Tenacibaculum ascidiaceicola TaxID=1699411 RepID=UPI003892F157